MGLLVTILLISLAIIFIWILLRIRKPRVYYNPNGNAAQIVTQMKSINEKYFPTPWLISPDIHTMWGMRFRPRSKLSPVREELDFPDGGCTQLDWFLPKTIEKNVPGFMKTERMNDGLHLDDIQNILKYVKEKYQPSDVFMVGFSMGAYITAEYCNLDGDITAGCCISHTYVPLEAIKILEDIPKNRKLYLPIIVAKLKHLVMKNQFISQEIKDKLKNVKTLHEYDDIFTAQQAGVKDHIEYYQRVTLAPKIATMKCPMLFIGSDDDPFTSSKLMPIKECKESQNCAFVETKEGGHVTFAQGWDGKTTYAEKVALEWFAIAAKVHSQQNK